MPVVGTRLNVVHNYNDDKKALMLVWRQQHGDVQVAHELKLPGHCNVPVVRVVQCVQLLN